MLHAASAQHLRTICFKLFLTEINININSAIKIVFN